MCLLELIDIPLSMLPVGYLVGFGRQARDGPAGRVEGGGGVLG